MAVDQGETIDLTHLSVLIVDDSATIRALIKSILWRGGVRLIVEAEDGEAAIRSLIHAPVHLVLADYLMKSMDGVTLTQKIRAATNLNKKFSPKIIMITGHSDVKLIRDAVGAGIDDFVVKPVSPKLLFDKIARAFKGIPIERLPQFAAPTAN